ncbi:MAG: hypothetical protein LUC47_09585 [Clostridiales bacterium]|nr:hypothetical protein [Clostridiales bacterium]
MKRNRKRIACLSVAMVLILSTGCASHQSVETKIFPVYGAVNCFPEENENRDSLNIALLSGSTALSDDIVAVSFGTEKILAEDFTLTKSSTGGGYTLWYLQGIPTLTTNTAVLDTLTLIGTEGSNTYTEFGSVTLNQMETSIYDVPEVFSVRSVTAVTVGRNTKGYPAAYSITLEATATLQLTEVTVPGYEGYAVSLAQHPASAVDGDDETLEFEETEYQPLTDAVILEEGTLFSLFIDFSSCDCPEAMVYYTAPVLEMISQGNFYQIGAYGCKSGLLLSKDEIKDVAALLYNGKPS